MREWIKAIRFVISFCAFAYIGGFMLLLGAHSAAKIVGVSVVLAVDEAAGGER